MGEERSGHKYGQHRKMARSGICLGPKTGKGSVHNRATIPALHRAPVTIRGRMSVLSFIHVSLPESFQIWEYIWGIFWTFKNNSKIMYILTQKYVPLCFQNYENGSEGKGKRPLYKRDQAPEKLSIPWNATDENAPSIWPIV